MVLYSVYTTRSRDLSSCIPFILRVSRVPGVHSIYAKSSRGLCCCVPCILLVPEISLAVFSLYYGFQAGVDKWIRYADLCFHTGLWHWTNISWDFLAQPPLLHSALWGLQHLRYGYFIRIVEPLRFGGCYSFQMILKMRMMSLLLNVYKAAHI